MDAGPVECDYTPDTLEDDPTAAKNCMGTGCSLRGALARARADGVAKGICVKLGEVALASPLTIDTEVTIAGRDRTMDSVCGSTTVPTRIFRVRDGGTLHLRDIKICNGQNTDEGGAAVFVTDGGALDTDRVDFVSNKSTSDAQPVEGGAIRVEDNVILNLRRTFFFANSVETSDTASNGSSRGGGLALLARNRRGTYLIEDTAFDSGVATDVGGGVYLEIPLEALTLRRVLFDNNSANLGGAIDVNCAASGTLTIQSSTFTRNTTGDSTGGVVWNCGVSSVAFEFISAANNSTPLMTMFDASGTATFRGVAVDVNGSELCETAHSGSGTSFGGNVVSGTGGNCALGTSDRMADPMFGSLADNGGETSTLAFPANSAAVDAAGTGCPTTDQRGMARPLGAACDAGAIELR